MEVRATPGTHRFFAFFVLVVALLLMFIPIPPFVVGPPAGQSFQSEASTFHRAFSGLRRKNSMSPVVWNSSGGSGHPQRTETNFWPANTFMESINSRFLSCRRSQAPCWKKDKWPHQLNIAISYSNEDERQYQKRQEEFRRTDAALRLRLWILMVGLAVMFAAPFVAGVIDFIRYDWPNRQKRVP